MTLVASSWGPSPNKRKKNTAIRRGRVEIHQDQAIDERFNRTLAERLFGHQYAVEMRPPERQRSTEWVKRLPFVVSALNNEVTRLIGKKPAEDIKEKVVFAKPSTPYLRLVGKSEKMPPFRCECSLSLPAWRAGGRPTPRHRPYLVAEGLQHRKKRHLDERRRAVLFARQAQARFRS